MAQAPNVKHGDSTPEQVAYELMKDVMGVETRPAGLDYRKWLLDTYAECLEAVQNHRARLPPKS